MSRAIVKRSLIVMTALLVGGGALTACGGGGEELQLVRAFFQASRFGDRSTLGNMTMVFFDPDEEGIASSPSVDSVTEEQRRSLQIQELTTALMEIEAEEVSFREEKKMYQDENVDAITRVLEAQRVDEDVASGDEEVAESWNMWVDDERAFARKVSDARAALQEVVRIAEASVFDPSNPIDVTAYAGELVTKDVTVTATVTKDDVGEERTMVFTIQRVELQDGEDGVIAGRWIITAIE